MPPRAGRPLQTNRRSGAPRRKHRKWERGHGPAAAAAHLGLQVPPSLHLPRVAWRPAGVGFSDRLLCGRVSRLGGPKGQLVYRGRLPVGGGGLRGQTSWCCRQGADTRGRAGLMPSRLVSWRRGDTRTLGPTVRPSQRHLATVRTSRCHLATVRTSRRHLTTVRTSLCHQATAGPPQLVSGTRGVTVPLSGRRSVI